MWALHSNYNYKFFGFLYHPGILCILWYDCSLRGISGCLPPAPPSPLCINPWHHSVLYHPMAIGEFSSHSWTWQLSDAKHKPVNFSPASEECCTRRLFTKTADVLSDVSSVTGTGAGCILYISPDLLSSPSAPKLLLSPIWTVVGRIDLTVKSRNQSLSQCGW